MMARPNPDGWRGGSENFDTVWTLHGHRPETAAGLFFDRDNDPDDEAGVTRSHDPIYGG